MRRKLFWFAAAFSLLICAATAYAWAGSVFVRCSAEFNGKYRPFKFTTLDLCFLGMVVASAVLPTISVARLARSVSLLIRAAKPAR